MCKKHAVMVECCVHLSLIKYNITAPRLGNQLVASVNRTGFEGGNR